MFALRTQAKRFTLLLLEEEEDYVGDFVAACNWPASISGNTQQASSVAGSIRICSKSFFFEPDDVRIPIVRIPFAAVQQLEGINQRSLMLVTTQLTKMKVNTADAPYIVQKGPASQWQFTLTYTTVDQILLLLHEQLAASRLPYADRKEALQESARQRAAAALFDKSLLVDFGEQMQYDAPATQLTPLVREAGRMVVTDQRVYFQPLHNVTGGSPVLSHPLSAVAAVAHRNSSLRPIGLELFFIEGGGGPQWGAPSAFFAFPNAVEAGKAAEAMLTQAALGEALPGGKAAASAAGSILEAGGGWLAKVTGAWQAGRINNLDYLLYCNLAAGRSFNDLTQWPVFPWILADYTSTTLDLDNPASFRDLSKPIGALNPQRLESYRFRFREMPREEGSDPPFLYGTHYSCPGYVMYWLVRAAPGHLLRLQNGRFDVADRMFYSIPDSWDSVTSNPADVKELIPEFFLSNGSFLVNNARLPLGLRQNGKSVDAVQLPPWASSPQDFIAQHRAALESPYISVNLHHWIDLIFGYKQRGQAAEAADNVFHHLTYEGAVDVEHMTDKHQRAALESQINEFGQCPRQLFSEPHPQRLVCPPPPDAASLTPASSTSSSTAGTALSLTLLTTIVAATNSAVPPPSPGFEETQMLHDLNVMRRQPAEPPSPTSSSSSGDLVEVTAASPSSGGETGRKLPDRVRNWSGRMGGSLSAMVDNLTKGSPLSGQGGLISPRSMSGTTGPLATSLKGLFQRQQSPSAPLPAFTATRNSTETPKSSVSVGAASTLAADSQRLQSHAEASTSAATATSSQAAAQPLDDALQSMLLGKPSASSGISNPVSAAVSRQGSSTQTPQPRAQSARPWLTELKRGFQGKGEVVASQQGAATAVALAEADGQPMAYFVGHNATVKICSLTTKAQVRSAKLGSLPLTSLALLHQQGQATAGHPVVLSGSYDNHVHAYSVEYGRQLGKWQAHDDGVSCLQLLQPDSLVTASWDCSLKLWRLAEGRQPWSSNASLPECECSESDSGLWALATPAAPGGLVLGGTEEGKVIAWDVRTPAPAWQTQVCSEYIGSLAQTPDGQTVIAARGDGNLSLLDLRKAGEQVAVMSHSSPLLCCQTDGQVAVTGSQDGQVTWWQLKGQQRCSPEPVHLGHAACNALVVDWLPTKAGKEPDLHMLCAHEDGLVQHLCTDQHL